VNQVFQLFIVISGIQNFQSPLSQPSADCELGYPIISCDKH